MQVRAILIDCVKISELRIPNTLLALQKFLGPELDIGRVSNTTQVLFCPANGAGHFCLPGGLKLSKAIIIDFADGEYRDVSWTAAEVAARVKWGQANMAQSSKLAPARKGNQFRSKSKRSSHNEKAHLR